MLRDLTLNAETESVSYSCLSNSCMSTVSMVTMWTLKTESHWLISHHKVWSSRSDSWMITVSVASCLNRDTTPLSLIGLFTKGNTFKQQIGLTTFCWEKWLVWESSESFLHCCIPKLEVNISLPATGCSLSSCKIQFVPPQVLNCALTRHFLPWK